MLQIHGHLFDDCHLEMIVIWKGACPMNCLAVYGNIGAHAGIVLISFFFIARHHADEVAG
jgi:hypothetical protein